MYSKNPSSVARSSRTKTKNKSLASSANAAKLKKKVVPHLASVKTTARKTVGGAKKTPQSSKVTVSSASSNVDSGKLVPWVAAESYSLTKVTKMVRKQLKCLTKKLSSKRVHKARVALRHWTAVWSVLKEDGWESDKFNSSVNKPLRKLLGVLGEVRDVDINLELGEHSKVSKKLLKQWSQHRDQQKEELSECINNLQISKIRKKLKRHAANAPKVVSSAIKRSNQDKEDPESHLNTALESQERIARKLSEFAASSDDYHQLRLAVKQWRYILEDLYGTEHLDLVVAQSKLGELHDCDRVREMLIDARSEIGALAILNQTHRKLVEEVSNLSSSLPFGFRPKVQK